MSNLLDALHLERPVFWLLHESRGVKGFPHETTICPDPDEMCELGYGIFFCPNELGNEKNGKGNLRHEKNVIRFPSVFVDLDSGTPEDQYRRIRSFYLPPSAIVRTGRGHHAYWLLNEPCTAQDWQRVQKYLAHTLSGDPACTDPARLMRLPDTWHVKNEPRLVELVHLNAQWMYSLSQFNLTPETKKIFYLSPAVNTSRRILKPPRAPTNMLIEEGMRHMTLLKECARYLRGVAPSELTERIQNLKSWYAQSSRPLKKNWEREVDDVVSWIINKELGNI